MYKHILSTLAAAGIFLAATGCAESPFKVNTRKDGDSVIIKIADKDGEKVVVNYKRLASPHDLQATLNEYGLRFPGRPVTLEIRDDADVRIEPNVVRMVKNAGLGPIAVMEGSELHGSFQPRPVRSEMLKDSPPPSEPTPETTPVAAPANPPADGVANTPPPAESAPAAAPAVTPAPAPDAIPETAAAAPAVVAPVAVPPAAVTVVAKDNGDFLVNGTAVPRDQLASALAQIGQQTPGAKVRYSREPAAPGDSVLRVYDAAKAAKLGPVSRE